MMNPVTTWQEVLTTGMHWQVNPACRDRLLGTGTLPLAEWLQRGQAQLVKKGRHRLVYRVDLPDFSFYLKHNLIPDWKTWARQMIRPSKARLEFTCIQAVAARGIPTVTPLALGERKTFWGAGESMLLTRNLEGAVQLNSFLAVELAGLPRQRQLDLRQHLAAELGIFVARLHDAGLQFHDLHAANILVRLEGDDRLALYLIDLHAIHMGPPLSWKASEKNLIILNRWFVPRSSRSDRLRFWRAYYQARGLGNWAAGMPNPRRHLLLARDLEKQTWLSNLAFWKERDSRCLGSNAYFRQVSGGNLVGHAVADLDGRLLQNLLADPDAPFHWPQARLLKKSVSSMVVEIPWTANGRTRPVIYKKFMVTAWSDPWASLVRCPPALRSWINGHNLGDRCLPTARPLAVFHRRRRGLLYEGYLLTEKIEDAQDLHAMLSHLSVLREPERRRQLRRRIDDVARIIRELHWRRLSHRDLKAPNILVAANLAPGPSFFQPVPPPSQPGMLHNSLPVRDTAVWLIDLVGLRRCRHLSRRRRVQNLARLNASFINHPDLTRSDRLRFLRVYLQWGLRGHGSWKSWWRAIAQATARKAARNLRIGRPLE